MNRRGDIFMLLVDLFFLIAIITIFWRVSGAYMQQNSDEGIGTAQAALLHTYAISDQMLLYTDEAAKYAAYESLASVMDRGGKSVVEPLCAGTYAGYDEWATATTMCFPNATTATDDIYTTFRSDMQINLKRLLQYPGFPSVEYDIRLVRDNGLHVIGTTNQKITLPILSAKDATEQQINALLTQENVAKTTGAAFTPDYLAATVIPSVNTKERTSTISHIIIASSLTEGLEKAKQKYSQGQVSTHYLIDAEGRVIQYVPETERAFGLSCQDCVLPDAEDSSIIVTVVNAGPTETKDGKCAEGTPLAKTQWCTNCAGNYQARCWAAYTAQQFETLTLLVSDIAKRQGIKPENILLEDQVDPRSDSPGPALRAMTDQRTWLAELQKTVLIAQTKTNQELHDDVDVTQQVLSNVKPVSSGDLSVTYPVDKIVISSCFGDRSVSGSEEHYGVDFAIPEGSNVYAVADGVVQSMCDDYQGACACSTRNSASCAAKCSQLCAGNGKGYGNNLLLKHSNDLSSHYSHLSKLLVKPGEQVKKGQVVALSGNTGSSTGPHLHFAVFYGEFKSLAKQNAGNPLCIFPDEMLNRMAANAANCKQRYTKLSHEDPQFATECKEVTPLESTPDCGVNSMPLDAKGNAEVTATMAALGKIPGLLDEIKAAGEKEGVDPKLLIAQITRESTGNPDIISRDGGVGIAQFTNIEVSRKYFGEIDKNLVNRIVDSPCRKDNSCTDASYPASDPRRDPKLSVQAQAKMMRDNIKHFSAYEDALRFGLAEYNTGMPNVEKALSKTILATGDRDPSWELVAPRTSPITQKYVTLIMQYYTSLGGTGVFGDERCGGLTVKEFGTYSFTPSFSVVVPDLLTSFDRTLEFAKKTYEECDGRDQSSTAACLEEHKDAFNRQMSDLAATNCEDDAGRTLSDAQQALLDCQRNQQDACTCSFSLAQTKTPVVLQGLQRSVIVQTPPNHDIDMPLANVYGQKDKSVQIRVQDRVTLIISDRDGTNAVERVTQKITVYKEKGVLQWVPDDANLPMCGDYKTEHQICVQVKHPIPVLSKGTELEIPAIKFALQLNDSYAPESVQNAMFVAVGSVPLFTFSPSTSKDISYYLLKCTGNGIEGKEVMINGRKDGRRIDGQFTIETCNGLPFTDGGSYKIAITSVDLSANRGKALSCDTQKNQIAQALTGVSVPLTCQ